MVYFVLLAFFSILLHADGETIYKNKCASCHKSYITMGELKENFVEYNNTKLKLKAPTFNQLSFRLKQKIGDPRGDKEIHMMEVTSFIQDYIINPSEEKSLCMKDVLEAFDTMPSLKGLISEDESEEVSEYLYHFDKKSLAKNAPKYLLFEKAIQKAKDENKIVMLKIMSEHCYYCKKMDREVLSEKEVLDMLSKLFVSVEIDVFKYQMPLGLSYSVTPTYIFLDSDAKVLKKVSGSWDKSDFLEILKKIETMKKGGNK